SHADLADDLDPHVQGVAGSRPVVDPQGRPIVRPRGAVNVVPSQFAKRAIGSSDPGVLGAYRRRVGYVGHQSISRNLTEQSGLEVFHGLPQFGGGVHHEGPIRRDRFANGLSTQDEQLHGRSSRVLEIITSDLEPLAAAEHHQLTVMYRSPFGTHAPSAGENVYERVEGRIPGQLQSRAWRN